MSPQEFLAAWTGLDANQRKKRLQWFAAQDGKVQHEIMNRHLELVGTARNTGRWIKDLAGDNTLGCLIQAIDQFWRIDNSDRVRNATEAELEAKDLSDFRKIKVRKGRKSDKRERVAAHYKVIWRFREDEGSWRDIAEYLRKNSKLEVSHTYVQQVFDAIALERREKDPYPKKC